MCDEARRAGQAGNALARRELGPSAVWFLRLARRELDRVRAHLDVPHDADAA